MPKYAICPLPFAPMRTDPDHRNEMSNQVIFGEMVEVLEEDKNGWWRVRVLFDGYEGWVRHNQLMETAYFESEKIYNGSFDGVILLNGYPMRIPFGSDLTWLKQNNVMGDIRIVDSKLHQPTEENILKVAGYFLNTTYLWGGRTIFGIDCSGFAQSVLKMFNIPLLRDAKQQVTQGSEVGFLEEAKYGDLAFFDDDEGKIVHVGILISTSEIIHASGQVRIDKIDNMGIVHSATGERTHKLRIIKRFF